MMLRFSLISVAVDEPKQVRVSMGEDPYEDIRARCEQIINDHCWVTNKYGEMVKVQPLQVVPCFTSTSTAIISVAYDAKYYFGDVEER